MARSNLPLPAGSTAGSRREARREKRQKERRGAAIRSLCPAILRSDRVVFALCLIVLIIVVAYPLGRILYQSFRFDDALSLGNYVRSVTAAGFFKAVRNSLATSILTTLFATTFGTLLAWVASRTDVPGKRFFRTAFLFPFIIPPFIGAFAWRQLLGPAGYLNKLIMTLSGIEEPFVSIYGFSGIVFVMSVHLYPLAYIQVLGALDHMNPELEEAAQISGSRPFSVMRRITLPLMLPAIASSAVLIFIASIANFGIPAILGFPANFYVMTTRIYESITRSAQPNTLSLASAQAVILAVIAGTGLILQRFILRGKQYTVISGKSIHPQVVRLGPHAVWITVACLLVVIITSAAPVIAVILTALTKAYGLAPGPANWTLENFRDVLFVNHTVRRAIRNSLSLAVGAATIVTVVGAVLSYIVVKTRVKGRFVLDFIANMPYALPGTVVAVAMILAWLRPIPVLGIRMYNTIWILLVAYVARYLAFGVRASGAALTQIHESLEEAARISGASWVRTFKDVVVPLILPGLVAGWFMVFMPSLRELTISVLLWSTKNETIGVMVFNLQESGNAVDSAALAVVMMVMLVMANAATRLLARVVSRHGRRARPAGSSMLM